MHTTSGRWQLGLSLTLLTATMWGLLPLGLKGLLQYMDTMTITWYRFFVATGVLTLYFFMRNRFPQFSKISTQKWLLIAIIVVVGLLGNYWLYLAGLNYITPEGAQITIQTAPMLLLLGSVIIFKESFTFKQWLGLFTFCTGLILFFNQRLTELIASATDYSWGILLVFIAGILWATYAMAQKELLKRLASEEIMFLVYIGGSLVFLPFSDISLVSGLDRLGWFLLFFCVVNTLVAYGCFAEALEHWEASRVSATLSITPILTMLFAYLINLLFTDALDQEPMNLISMIGAGLVVGGSAVAALSKSAS